MSTDPIRFSHETASVEYLPTDNPKRFSYEAASVEYLPTDNPKRFSHIAVSIEVDGIYAATAPSDNKGTGNNCNEGGFAAQNALTVANVSAYDGEVRQEETEFALATPAGALTYTRSYRQGVWGADTDQVMGMGWTYNHQLSLQELSGRLLLRSSNGSEIYFNQVEMSSHYEAAPGGTAVIDWDEGEEEYTLTNVDESRLIFDSDGRLVSRAWANGETWTYLYPDDQLSEVNDGHGRKLVFRYYTSGIHDGQLYRVGDQTFDDTDPDEPLGRYVQLDYVSDKIVDEATGAIIDGTGHLLHEVRDVRGESWLYEYYGQEAGEIDTRMLNFLVRRLSPLVKDTNADNIPDERIVLEELSYEIQGTQLAVNGDMEVDSHWSNIGGAVPDTNVQSSAQTYSPSYSRHIVASAAEQGIEGELWDLVVDRTYIVTAQVYPVSGVVKMQVTGESAFDRVSTGTADWEILRVVYRPTSSSSDHRLQFVADSSTAEFFVDEVSILETNLHIETIEQKRGDSLLTTSFEFQPDGQELTRAVTAVLQTTYLFPNGIFTGVQNEVGSTTSQLVDVNYRVARQTDANGSETRLYWSSDGKHLYEVVDPLGQRTYFSYNLNNTLRFSVDHGGRRTEYLYEDSAQLRQPTDIKIIGSGEEVIHWQKLAYDAQGRVVTEQTVDPSDDTNVLQETTRIYYSSGVGNGLLASVTQVDLIDSGNNVSTTYTYDSAGRVVKAHKSSLFGSCQVSYTVYDVAGNVVASICNYHNVGAAPVTASEAAALYDIDEPDKNRITLYEYDPLGRRVKTVTNAGVDENAVHAQTVLTVYDALDRVVRAISNYVVDIAIPDPYSAPHNAFDHGMENNQNLVTDTVYNARGLVCQQVDVLGNVTLYGYDDADRLVKTIQNASEPNYNNDYVGTLPDPALEAYIPNSNVDQDIVTTQKYDANGNLVKTTDALGNVSYTVYDALNRPVKTVRSAKDVATIDLNEGDPEYDDENDPRSEAYVPSIDPDRDLVETTEYNQTGAIVRTRRLIENRPAEIWETTLYGYDLLNRQVKVIRNASDPDYDLASDRDLSDYSPSTADDQDLITTTIYDIQGRVLFTEDTLGAKTCLVYDGLNRQVKTIANFVEQDEDPSSWIWSDTNSRWETSTEAAIDHGAKNDRNIISETIYDSDGNVQEVRDVLGRLTHYSYDDVNRAWRTVTNYVPQGSNDPNDWIWDDGWKQSDSMNAPAVSHGTDNDENIISSTGYDVLGRVSRTIDQRNNVTLSFYDTLGRRVKTVSNYIVQGASDPADWVWSEINERWEDGAGNAISFGTENDQNQVMTTVYDLVGRIVRSRDASGQEMRHEYDALRRRIETVVNYVDGVFNSGAPDEDLISVTSYNKGGQTVSITDVRGTDTALTYDEAGRRLSVTQAAGSSLATTAYTCYDKAGRTLRTIANWSNAPTQPDPDSRDAITGAWLFVPAHHGRLNDRDLVTLTQYDFANRAIQFTNALGDATYTTYFKDGSVASTVDPLGVVTVYRYDGLRRRTRIVQSFVDPGEDPALWVWDNGWKESDETTAIVHGVNSDQNVIVDLELDQAGRIVSQRDPRGNITAYAYDKLNRRKTLTNPLSKTWTTEYVDLSDGKTQTTMTLPGITGAANYTVQRQFDRLGRAHNLAYGDTSGTHDVTFSYDNAGNRTKMRDYDSASFTGLVRETSYNYDRVRRLTSVEFDEDGDSNIEQTVSYEYDAGGLRTKLTLPGDLEVVYQYDKRGQLIRLTDWDDQTTRFAYDDMGRQIASERSNGLRTRYQYDAGSRLRALRHRSSNKTLAQFIYAVDARGNRTQVQEMLAHPATSSDVTIAYDDAGIVTTGTWTNVSSFKQSTEWRASLLVGFVGDAATLTMGTGADHSLYDVYIDGSLWQSFDGYAASSPSEVEIVVTLGVNSRKLTHEGLHILEIRNRAEHGSQSSGYKVRFKQLVIGDKAYDLHTIQYQYDALSRLLSADTYPGVNVNAVPTRSYAYSYDAAGNRLSEAITLNGGSPATVNYTYNAANQLTSDGTNTLTYDNNGNLTSDGVNSYTWDRANRLLSMGGSNYAYDGAGNRISQTVGVDVTKYLLDLQPGLATVLQATQGSDTTRYLHAPGGIHAQQDASDNWTWMLQDGLGSVRSVVDSSLNVLESRLYEPYGTPFGTSGTQQTVYGFTGEQTDGNGQVYLRARYYNPSIGVFTALDPFEGQTCSPMSLNRYSWVEGNPINRIDPTGMFGAADSALLNMLNGCSSNKVIGGSRRRQIGTSTPKPCSITDTERAKNILAVSSYREASNGCSPFSEDDQNRQVITALMLMQFNNIRTGRGNVSAAGVKWRGIGSLNYSTVDANTFCGGIDQWIIDLAGSMVDNYCTSSNPISSITNLDTSLTNLATDDLALHEVSIHITQAEAFRADLRQPVQYLYDDPSTGRTVVVGGVNITRAFIGYQCASNEQYVISDFPDVIRARPTNAALSSEGNFSCRPAPCTINEWYLEVEPDQRTRVAEILGRTLSGSAAYEIVTRQEWLSVRREFPGGNDYAKECS